jgi:LacI family transcriptional regulator
MITIKDVARLANVSAGTVSNVFNKPECVAPETIERVKNAAKELDYYPNRIARGLVNAKTQLIGLVLSNLHNTMYARLAKSVENTLKRFNYNLMLINTDYSLEHEIEAVRCLMETKVDGIILGSSSVENGYDHLVRLKNLSIPVVVINRNIDEELFDQIIYDAVKGCVDAINHLLALGHKKIGFIGGPFKRNNCDTAMVKRFLGYRLALEDKGLIVDQELVFAGKETTYDEGFRLAQEMLVTRKDHPTALFVPQDDMAIGAMAAITAAGLTVPGDISVIGFTNHFYSRYAVPPLTTVNIPSYEAGELAAEMIIEKIGNKNLPIKTIYMPCKLICRASTAAVKAGG